MNDWTPPPRDVDLERADDLLGQADALLHRHRAHADNEALPPSSAPHPAPAFDDDLPLLTEIVDDAALPPAWPAPTPPRAFAADGGAEPELAPEHPAASAAGTPQPDVPAPFSPPAPSRLAEEETAADPGAAAAIDDLNERAAEMDDEMDGEIARALADQVATELGRIIDRELDALRERLHGEMLAHLRATLLPGLSARIGTFLKQTADPGRNPDRPPTD